MIERCPQLGRFIRRVHRRLVCLRTLEAGGVGIAVAALSAIPILLLNANRDFGASPPIAPLLGLGVLGGGLWAILRHRQLIQTAAEIDRQLGLADLLSTAWAIRKRTTTAHDLSAAVLAIAEKRCSRLRLSDVTLARFGRRAWGAIGLLCILCLFVGIFTRNPLEPNAVKQTTITQHGNGDHRMAGPNIGRFQGMRQNSPTAVNADHPGGNDAGFDPSRNTTTLTETTERTGGAPASANPQGTGAGAGRSNNTERVDPLTAGGANASDGGLGQTPAAGSGAPTADATAGKGQTGTAAGNAPTNTPTTPPWKMIGWAQAAERAEAAIRSGRVPAEYQDILQIYFERD